MNCGGINMEGEKPTRIQSLNQSETEVLHVLFRDPSFKVPALARDLFRGEGGIRTNLTAIFNKLEVPGNEANKREWVVREYSEAYEYVFKKEEWEAKQAEKRLRGQPEIFKKPPDPIPINRERSQSRQATSNIRPSDIFIIILVVLLASSIFSIVYLLIDNDNLDSNLVAWQEYGSTMQAAAQTSEVKAQISQAMAETVVAGAAIPDTLPGPILLLENFDNGATSPQWQYYGTPMIWSEEGFVYAQQDGFIGIKVDNPAWRNYILYTRIITKGCVVEGKTSKLGVRVNGPNFIVAYEWNSCDFPAESDIKPVIKVQKSQLTVTVNGEEITKDFFLPGHEVGGIIVEVFEGSAIDYVQVIGLPD
jgi:hypothetical protein